VSEIRVVPFLVSEVRLPPDEQEILQREWWPSYAHAVIHRDGVFLFDNGFGTGNAEVEAMYSPRVTMVEDALAQHGISLADVTGAANCHLHADHSGQNVRLKGIPIFVQRREWKLMEDDPDHTIREWVDAPGLSYEVLDGESEVAPGIRIVPTPGHTAGHQSAVLETGEGTIVFAGQALQSRAEWEGATEHAVSGASAARDPAYADSVARLKALDPVRVHFAHDASFWER
jgi:glyoxylase-like metal-dependent hydrolase (beta-lactamase superfamily II)